MLSSGNKGSVNLILASPDVRACRCVLGRGSMGKSEAIQTARALRDGELDVVSGGEIRRSMPNGRTDVIKAMGNTKWADEPLVGSLWDSLWW